MHRKVASTRKDHYGIRQHPIAIKHLTFEDTSASYFMQPTLGVQ